MRIGIFCNTFGRSGGMETYALNMVKACLELGHSPIVFCKKADRSIPFAAQCVIHEYSLEFLPNKLRLWLFHQWLSKITKTVKVDFSIGCCLGGFPEVIVCGGTRIGYLKAMRKTVMPWDRLLISIERASYGNAKFVVAHAKTMKRELTEFYGIDSSKISVIYPPQQFAEIKAIPDIPLLRKKYGLPEDKTIFLFPSLSHKRKGFDLLKQYFINTKHNVLLAVAGKPIPSGCNNILHLGFCNNMQEVYQLSDYTILASFYDPLGTVGIESIWNGTPAIMAAGIGCNEVIDPAVIRSFDPYSYKSLYNCLEDLHEKPIKKLDRPYKKYLNYPIDKTPETHLQEIINLIFTKEKHAF